jgi:hypothetical protein
LGDVDDLVHTASAARATAIHFSGHGLPGQLVLEDGLADFVKVDEMLRRLNVHLRPGSKTGPFPGLFFLASCYGASGDTEHGGDRDEGCRSDGERHTRELDVALGKGPSTAATLHRSGFVQVLGYFGPRAPALFCWTPGSLLAERPPCARRGRSRWKGSAGSTGPRSSSGR